MKIFVLMLSFFLVINSYAQTQKNSVSTKAKSKQSKKMTQKQKSNSAKTNQNAVVTRLPKKKKDPKYSPLYPFTNSTQAAEGSLGIVQKEKVEVAPLVQAEQPKKWYLRFDSENMKNVTDENAAGYNGDIFAVQTLSYGYRFTDTSTVQVSQDWTQSYGYGTTPEGEENRSNEAYEDLSFRYIHSSIIKTENSNLAGQFRYYAPISKGSQQAGQVGQLRAYAIYSYTLSPQFSLGYIFNPRFFMQTANAFENDDGKTINNNHWRLLNIASATFAPNDWFNIRQEVGLYSKKRYNESTRHFQHYSTSFGFSFLKLFSLELGLRASDNGYDTRDKGGFNFYDMDVSEYYGIFTIRI